MPPETLRPRRSALTRPELSLANRMLEISMATSALSQLRNGLCGHAACAPVSSRARGMRFSTDAFPDLWKYRQHKVLWDAFGRNRWSQTVSMP